MKLYNDGYLAGETEAKGTLPYDKNLTDRYSLSERRDFYELQQI